MISRTGERIAAAFSVVVAAYFAYAAWNFPAGGEQFPLFATISIGAIAVAMVFRTIVTPDAFTARFVVEPLPVTLRPIAVTAAVAVYVLAIFQLGYYTSTLLFLIATSWLVGVRRPMTIAIAALVTLPLMYAFFELFLEARMPRGLLV